MPISGETIASQLNISRAAVCKNIKHLKEEGYQIEAATNRGYILSSVSDIISKEGILPFLLDQYKNIPIETFKTIDSTNLYAKRLAVDGAESGTCVIAEEQTKGRGRRGRDFYSPKGYGIYMSLILRLNLNLLDSVLITTAASVAVSRAIESVTTISPKIKWVNDLYVNGKKVCGILTEAVTDFETGTIDSVVLGIGINFYQNPDGFPDELTQKAGALFGQKPTHITRNQLCAAIINEMLNIVQSLSTRAYLSEYKERCLVLNQKIAVITINGSRLATALDIDSNGGLIVRYEDGQLDTLNSGEITIRPQTL